uniref:SET domain-containing protein n=1 Tax=Aureoumbra lagunensis TaxID=44058 RepID=A0A7S3JVN7_9STRA|mmetsp:Transcript_980/g.1389  ORF Transcript_980/g.1389 Transcript_980/m.1389 type:complete len:518 (-) Transcript_980:68-1621(-)|eukprot:CAMPEP_0197320454 /NCGR_PEP_ID=MMETSP0891-20130614/59931_1 /TAXON_ID=44058 ORGANISM="Aureoumbra lagunensis, Strain CCMP1510" /NCGR_SAMPLE_ID=MMETSP0891 /ASSEMBLY_ACC=CAM_ASM_000534 /LENGTH=517 /DNA_ID=CAMNT_0042811847 /DNA_START=84 /DNA_END=1637 /DNA_ORIENTATION=-
MSQQRRGGKSKSTISSKKNVSEKFDRLKCLSRVEDLLRDADLWENVDDLKLVKTVQKLEDALFEMRFAWQSWNEKKSVFQEARSENYEELRHDLLTRHGEENKLIWHPNAVFKTENNLGGMYASEKIDAGEILFCIPSSVMFLVPDDDIYIRNETFAMALRLAAEDQLPDSKFAIYLKCLPRKFCIPTVWPVSSFTQLIGSETLKAACNLKRAAATLYCQWLETNYIKQIGINQHKEDVFHLSYDHFIWALCNVVTRQNAIPVDGSKTKIALIPGWDLCNHHRDAPASLYRSDNCLELQATKDIEKGEQIYMFYGNRSSEEFVLHSGFLPLDCLHRVSIAIHLSDDSIYTNRTIAKLVPNLLAKAGFSICKNYSVRGSFRREPLMEDRIYVEPSLSAIALAVTADKSRLAHLIRSGHFTQWRPMDDDHAVFAIDFLRSICDKEIARRSAARAMVLHSCGAFTEKQQTSSDLLDLCDYEANPDALANALWTIEFSILLKVTFGEKSSLYIFRDDEEEN